MTQVAGHNVVCPWIIQKMAEQVMENECKHAEKLKE